MIASRVDQGVADPFRRRPALLDGEHVGEVGPHVERHRRRLIDRPVVADLDQLLQLAPQAAPADDHQAGAVLPAGRQRAQHERRRVSALQVAGQRLQHAAVDAQLQQAQRPQVGEEQAVGPARDVTAALAEAERLAVDDRDGTAREVGRHRLVVRVPGVLAQRHRSGCSRGDGALARPTCVGREECGDREIDFSVVAGTGKNGDPLDAWYRVRRRLPFGAVGRWRPCASACSPPLGSRSRHRRTVGRSASSPSWRPSWAAPGRTWCSSGTGTARSLAPS